MANINETYDIDPKTVQTFKDFGTFTNNIDSFGNLQILNTNDKTVSGNLCYVVLPLKTFEYDESQIIDNESVKFTEFDTPETQIKQEIQNVVEKYNAVISENRELNTTINSLVERYDNTDDKAVIETMRKKIIELRIQLGQGELESDFDEDFPFLATQ